MLQIAAHAALELFKRAPRDVNWRISARGSCLPRERPVRSGSVPRHACCLRSRPPANTQTLSRLEKATATLGSHPPSQPSPPGLLFQNELCSVVGSGERGTGSQHVVSEYALEGGDCPRSPGPFAPITAALSVNTSAPTQSPRERPTLRMLEAQGFSPHNSRHFMLFSIFPSWPLNASRLPPSQLTLLK